MSDFLRIGEIDSRRLAIGLEAKDLYERAKVGRATWHRAVAGSPGTRTGALIALTYALLAAEREMLAHLVALHSELAAELVATAKQEEAA